MLDQFSRTQLLIGREGIDRLSRARVAVFGVGGVGGYVCEALVRSTVYVRPTQSTNAPSAETFREARRSFRLLRGFSSRVRS